MERLFEAIDRGVVEFVGFGEVLDGNGYVAGHGLIFSLVHQY
jgi:hypothetical protein